MATNYCLPKKFTSVFLKAIQDGSLDINDLKNSSSAERRAKLADLLGDDNAKEVNTLFEEKLLVKNQQKAMLDWVRQVSGLSQPIRKSIEDQIVSMDKILNPVDEKSFLADLVNKKLGAEVTSDEAKAILTEAKMTSDLKTDWLLNPDDYGKRIAYGMAQGRLDDLVESMKPGGRTVGHVLVDLLNLPKTLQTSIGHLSAMAVQLTGTISTKEYWRGFAEMFKFFAKQENYELDKARIRTDPYYEHMKAASLQIVDIGNKLSTRDEAIQDHYVQQFNTYLSDKVGVPNLVKASSRAFTGVQNHVRTHLFVRFLKAAEAAGEDVRVGSQVTKDIAKTINDFTGRSSLGKDDRYSNAGPLMNGILYAPRKWLAGFNVINPWTYLDPRLSSVVRAQRIKLFLGAITTMGSMAMLLRSGGWKVDMNPNSQDFMAPISPGGEKYEYTGGMNIMVRLFSRLLTGRTIDKHGVETEFANALNIPGTNIPFGANNYVGHYVKRGPDGKDIDQGINKFADNRMSVLGRETWGKLAPATSTLTDFFMGHDAVGREFSVPEEVRHHLTPIVMSNLINFWTQNPKDTYDYAPSLLSILGVGLSSPLPPQVKQGMNSWGDPVNEWSWHDPVRSDLDDKLSQLGIIAKFPPDTINGVKLTDQQYQEYIHLSGQAAKEQITNLLNNPKFQSLPDNLKKQAVQEVFADSRVQPQAIIQMKSKGTDNDIVQKSFEAWKQKFLDQQQESNPQ